MSLSERLGLSYVYRYSDTETPFSTFDDEEIRGVFKAVHLTLSSTEEAGSGYLYLTTRRVVWLSAENADVGYSVGYPAVVVHAVAQDPSLCDGQRCIYVQLDPPSEMESMEIECSLVLSPEDVSKVDEMFKIFSECSALNPDSDDSDAEDVLNGQDEVFGADQIVQDLKELIGDDPARFDDPESEEDTSPQKDA